MATAFIPGFLLGSSLIGFHTHDYVRDFLTSVLRTSGYEHQLGSLTLRDRAVKVETFPMGVEFDRFATAAFAMGQGAIGFIEETHGLEGYAIDRNGVATMTSGFNRMVAP